VPLGRLGWRKESLARKKKRTIWSCFREIKAGGYAATYEDGFFEGRWPGAALSPSSTTDRGSEGTDSSG
jgi:hypothetical protein